MARAAEVYAVINFVVIGLSHLLQSRAWVEFFILLRERGHAGVFFNGMLSLMFGSIIVAFHNVWSGLPMVLTIIGWAQVVKGLMSLTVPTVGIKGMQRVSMERAGEFRIAGLVFLGLAALIAYTWIPAV